MKRLTFFATISALAVATAAPVLAAPGGNGGGNGGGRGIGAGGAATIDRGSQGMGRGLGSDNLRGSLSGSTDTKVRGNSRFDDMPVTGTRIPESAGRAKDKASTETTAGTRVATRAASTSSLTGLETGMTVNDSGGVAIGTVSGIITKGNGTIRAVQVTLTSGQIITLAPNGLTLEGDVLTTASTTSNLNSQGPAHANVNGLINASPNSVLATAGVTSLTGLATDLTVNNSVGDPLGTVGTIVTNRSGAVVGINVDLTDGGTVFIPATTLSMDGTTVVTSSSQF